MDEFWIQHLLAQHLKVSFPHCTISEETNSTNDIVITTTQGKSFLVQITEIE